MKLLIELFPSYNHAGIRTSPKFGINEFSCARMCTAHLDKNVASVADTFDKVIVQ